MTKTVYIVTSGCYSDYHIDYVASTKEHAEEYINHMSSVKKSYDIEECPLDEVIQNDALCFKLFNKIGAVKSPGYKKDNLTKLLKQMPAVIWLKRKTTTEYEKQRYGEYEYIPLDFILSKDKNNHFFAYYQENCYGDLFQFCDCSSEDPFTAIENCNKELQKGIKDGYFFLTNPEQK